MPGLTIKRTPHTKIMIGDAIVTILEVRGKHVTLNIQAPQHMAIRRLDVDGIPESAQYREEDK